MRSDNATAMRNECSKCKRMAEVLVTMKSRLLCPVCFRHSGRDAVFCTNEWTLGELVTKLPTGTVIEFGELEELSERLRDYLHDNDPEGCYLDESTMHELLALREERELEAQQVAGAVGGDGKETTAQTEV